MFVYASGLAPAPIRSDGFSYYVYLPSWFIYHDTTLASVADDCCGGEFPAFTAIIRWPGTNRWVNAHPIGVAVMQAPFFAIAHALTRWTNLSPDGFTLYYQHAMGLSGLFWTIAGLWVLGVVLRRYFTSAVTAATLVTILLGTSLFHYATFDSSYSHAYSFFLFAAFLDRGARRPRRGADRARAAHEYPASHVLRVQRPPRHAPHRADDRRLPARDRAAAGNLLPGNRAADRQLVRRAGIQLRIPAHLRRAFQHAEGAVLLVANPAAGVWRFHPARAVRALRAHVRAPGLCVPGGGHVPHCELVGLAVRRKLRTPRLRGCAAAVRHRPRRVLPVGIRRAPTTPRRRGDRPLRRRAQRVPDGAVLERRAPLQRYDVGSISRGVSPMA